MKKLLCILPFLLSGCQTVGGLADDIGEYMPVIGERCYNWQCFTDEGQADSQMNEQMMRRRQSQGEAGPAPGGDTNTNAVTSPPTAYPY